MRILHLTTFLQGGAGLAIVSLARLQRAVGHETVVVTSTSAPPGYGNYPAHLKTLEDRGVPVHMVDSLFYRDRQGKRKALAFIRDDLRASTFDILHAHAAVPARIGLALARAGGPALLQTMHGWGVNKTSAQERADIAVLKRVPRVIVPGTAARDLLVGFGVPSERVGIVPYGVEPVNDPLAGIDSLDPDLAGIRRARQAGRRVICCVGTIGERKNQRLLLDALAQLPEPHRLMCVLIGEGDLAGVLDHAERRGVRGSVHCTGLKSNARELMIACDALVLPSRSEGLPLSVLEAFCDRVPVIASDIPEIAEIVRDGEHGLTFTADHAGSLAAALDRFFAMPHPDRWAMCARAHERYSSEFRTGLMFERYMHEYAGLRSRTADTAKRCSA